MTWPFSLLFDCCRTEEIYTYNAVALNSYGTWHGKRNFFRRRPHGKSAYIARTISGFCTDNQRIPCGTISKFYSYNDISNDPCGVFLDPLALLRTKFAFWFPPFQTESARKIRARLRGRSAPTRTEDPRPPARKVRGTRAENLRRSAQNKHGIPQKKLSFPCHVP